MEENWFLLISILYILVAVYLLDPWKPAAGANDPDSETHARTRYSVAEKIQQESNR